MNQWVNGYCLAHARGVGLVVLNRSRKMRWAHRSAWAAQGHRAAVAALAAPSLALSVLTPTCVQFVYIQWATNQDFTFVAKVALVVSVN